MSTNNDKKRSRNTSNNEKKKIEAISSTREKNEVQQFEGGDNGVQNSETKIEDIATEQNAIATTLSKTSITQVKLDLAFVLFHEEQKNISFKMQIEHGCTSGGNDECANNHIGSDDSNSNTNDDIGDTINTTNDSNDIDDSDDSNDTDNTHDSDYEANIYHEPILLIIQEFIELFLRSNHHLDPNAPPFKYHAHYEYDHENSWHADDVDSDDDFYEDVLVYEAMMGFERRGLDLQTIAALTQFAYSRSNSQDISFKQKECIVCQSEFKGETMNKLPYKHAYYFECIQQWLQCKGVCPICNAQVS